MKTLQDVVEWLESSVQNAKDAKASQQFAVALRACQRAIREREELLAATHRLSRRLKGCMESLEKQAARLK